MMSLKHYLRLGGSVGVLLLSSGAYAQTAPASDPAPADAGVKSAAQPTFLANSDEIPEIIVTAQKRQESINKVGMAITALTGDELANKGVTSVADLVKVVPSFNFTPSAYGTPIYTLRGVGFYDTGLGAAPAVSVYEDEVPLPLSMMTTGAGLDVERVEVLKGPQGTLFGQNSTGGAINYIAAKPTASFDAGADVTLGNFGKSQLNGFMSDSLSDTLRARVAFRYDDRGAWQHSISRSDTTGRSEVEIGRLLLDWTPTDKLTVSLNVNGWHDHSDNQAAQLLAVTNPKARPAFRSSPLAPADDQAADWDPGRDFRRDVNFFQVSDRIDYLLSDWLTITSITAYEQLDRNSLVDGDGSPQQVLVVLTPGKSNDFNQELRASGDINRWRYVVGASYSFDNITDAGHAQLAQSSFPFSGTNTTTHQIVDTEGAFGHLEYKVVDAVTLEGGLRYTEQQRRFHSCTHDNGDGILAPIIAATATKLSGRKVVIPPGGCVTLGPNFLPGEVYSKLDENNLSLRAGVNWQVDSDSLLYATVSRGFKAGAFPTAAATGSAQFRPARQEELTAYETGFKLALANHSLHLDGALFYDNYINKQLRGKLVDPVLGPLNGLINVPKSRIAGAELQTVWRPARGLTLTAGASYIYSEIQDNFTNYDAIGTRVNMQGEAYPLAPKVQIVGDAQYDFSINSNFDGFVGGSVNHQGATNAGLGNLALFKLNAYTLFDARVGFSSDDEKWRATFFVRNLTDEYYLTFIATATQDGVIGYTGMPRTFGLTVSYRY